MRAWILPAAGSMIVVLLAPGAAAQESDNRVAAETDWSVFVEDDPRECWVVSQPSETVNTRGGNVVSVNRGDILLFATYRPEQGIEGEISFTGGYPFDPDTTVEVEIGDDSFELFVEDNWAWPASQEDDADLMEAMRGGAEAVVTGISSRGTQTEDTFSLFGFTAATEEAERRCSD